MRVPLAELFQFVIAVSKRYDIDESHSLGHSMRVLQFSDQIAREESRWTRNPTLFVEQRPVIQAAAILHDTCDKKYREEAPALLEVEQLLSPWMCADELNATIHIIKHMSYSKVSKTGMPDMGEYQTAFNVVREADLLDAYDFDRSMIYHMQKNDKNVSCAYEDACDLFYKRVLRHKDHGMLFTKFAIGEHDILSQKAITRMFHWRRVLK